VLVTWLPGSEPRVLVGVLSEAEETPFGSIPNPGCGAGGACAEAVLWSKTTKSRIRMIGY
jgi:UDP-N-acetyl-D-mannosaminuronate dehydrogenase